MTALSALATRRKAYLISDAGLFDVRTGELINFVPKVLCLPAISMAIGIQGYGTVNVLLDCINGMHPAPSQAGILEAIPSALAGMRLQAPVKPLSETRLWIAMFDRARRRPWLGRISSGIMPDGDGIPYQMQEGDGITGLSSEDLEGAFPGGWPRDPERDAVEIIKMQRHRPFPSLQGGIGVSGECAIYTIDAKGVSYRPLMRYDDVIGCRADPSLQPVMLDMPTAR